MHTLVLMTMVLAAPVSAPRPSIEPLLALTVVWNLIDLVATVFVVETGLAVEANPLMDMALGVGALPFAVIKLTLVSVGVYFLWRNRDRHLAAVGAIAIFAVYSFVVGYHGHQLGWLVSGFGPQILLSSV